MYREKTKGLLAVADGRVVPLGDVPDEVFAGGMLGDGFAVDPVGGTVYSPASGVVENVSETRHAYTIQTDDGLDVLVHVGVDTVNLRGEGFVSLVRAGDSVQAGDVIAMVDLSRIRAEGLSPVIPVVVSNREEMVNEQLLPGEVKGGKSIAFTYEKQS